MEKTIQKIFQFQMLTLQNVKFEMSEYSNTTQLNYSMHFFSYYYALSAQKVHVLQTAVVLRDHRT